jgi:hypothetical protein
LLPGCGGRLSLSSFFNDFRLSPPDERGGAGFTTGLPKWRTKMPLGIRGIGHTRFSAPVFGIAEVTNHSLLKLAVPSHFQRKAYIPKGLPDLRTVN